MICEKPKKQKKEALFLISFFFLISLISMKTLKKVDMKDIRISGSELFSQYDLVAVSYTHLRAHETS